MPRVELVDPETAPAETHAAYDEIRSGGGGMPVTDWRPLDLSPQIIVAVHKLFFRLQRERASR